ncbi:CPCC family cysteine-rich protein [Actinoplanes couchii]|uniref:CPCC family cysteine-rich protein n=1 Tax=Actinoplanes couchii TaxID=403638 RepID=UPI001EF38D91|nr:CPCC family cysteine-rich protein [Actinoplanes couchii]
MCCGHLTLTGPPGSRQVCRVCGWEDDVYRLRWPYRAGGSSLIEAQKKVTGPAEFDRDPFWRPIDTARDRFEPGGRELAPWPEDRTVLYWWRRRPGTLWWEEPGPRPEDAGDGPADDFAEAVRAVAAFPPATADNLQGMAVDFDHYLWECPSIRDVVVVSGPDPDRQLTAHCRAESASAPHRVAADVEQVWTRDLRYVHWEAHRVRLEPASVILDAVTVSSENGYRITATIVVTWA